MFFHSCIILPIWGTFYRCQVGSWVFCVCTHCFLSFLILDALYQIGTLSGVFLKRSDVPVDLWRYFISVKVCLTLGTAIQLFSAFPPSFLHYPSVSSCCILPPSNNTSHTHLTWQIINANDTFWLWLVLISIMSSNLLCFPEKWYWTFDTCFALLKCEYSMCLSKNKWPSSCMVELCVHLMLWY